MPTALVTGAAGFMGSHLCQHLMKKGYRVVGLDDLSGGFEANIPQGVHFQEGSTLDEALIEQLFERYSFDYVYHFAAYAAEGLSHFIRSFNYKNNILGSIHLINAAVRHEIKCFVFASSIAVYGHAPNPLHEALAPQPADPYGIAKLAVEQDLRAAKDVFDLDYLIFRPHNVYGPHQNIGDPYRNVVGIFMNQLLKGEALTVFGNGEQTRAFTYVEDLLPILADAVERPKLYNQVFNIGSDESYSVQFLAQQVMQAMGKEQAIRYLSARKEVVHARPSHAKIRKYFPAYQQTPLLLGLEKMAVWAQQHGARKGQRFEAIEIQKELPPSWRS